ncbi:matrix-remodeling-associated protein 7 isoform 3-T3 [Xenentodon cancila]
MSGSSHDHWDVVKSVRLDEDQPSFHTEEATLVEHSSSTASSLSVPCPGSRHMSLETEGATESPGINEEKVESDDSSSLRYIPGKARTHHLEMMMSKEELEEEQRVQREQLAAIFQLLKDNKETFGEVSDGDLEEQLRLYSI